MKQQKIMSIAIIVLLVAIICIQIFVKHKVRLNGMEGTSGVINPSSIDEPTETNSSTLNPAS